MAELWNIDWLNGNSQRTFPLADDADRLDTSASFKIPNDLLLDFTLPVRASSGIDPNGFYVSNITAFSAGVVVTVSYSGLPVCSCSILAATHEFGTAYTMTGTGEFADTAATLAVGDVAAVVALGGAWTFDLEHARINPSLIRPALQGVSAIRVVNEGTAGEWLTGDIELQSGRNIQFVVTPTAGGYAVRVDAISDESLGATCECSDQNTAGEPIRTINNVGPDANGNIQLVPRYSCLNIEAGTAKLTFEDTCSQTCCGCAELEVVTEDLNMLNREVTTLQGVASRLDQQTTALSVGLIVS